VLLTGCCGQIGSCFLRLTGGVYVGVGEGFRTLFDTIYEVRS
jgi:hypothetical protein